MTHQQAVNTLASERYLLDEMTEPEREVFEEHYFSCAECAEEVRTGAIMCDGTRAGLLEAPLEANDARVVPFRPRTWYRSAAIPWAVAATLAIVAGYQALVMVPALRSLNQPQALAPVTLRPASRGQEPRFSVGHGAPAITLAVDASSAVPGSALSYELRTSEGGLAAAGTVTAPAPGTPLLLLVPSQVVSTPGHYVLSIADGQYAFEVVTQ
jgi:hypothetical protein